MDNYNRASARTTKNFSLKQGSRNKSKPAKTTNGTFLPKLQKQSVMNQFVNITAADALKERSQQASLME